MSGYKPCACRDCMEIAIGEDDERALCHACKEAGCEDGEECQAPHAYCSGGAGLEIDGTEYCTECGQPF